VTKSYQRRLIGWATVAIILAAASLLRLRALTFQSYWNDELISAAISDPANSFLQVVGLRLARGTHPPLYNVVLWAWYSIGGYSELSGRLLSALVGIGGVAVIMGLGVRLFSARVALLAGALAAVNPALIYYSQEVRAYSFEMFLVPLGFLFFLSALQRFTTARGIAYVATMLVASAMHYMAIFSLVSQGVSLLLIRVEKPSGYRLTSMCWIGLTVLVVAVGAVLHPIAARQVSEPMPWLGSFDPAFAGKALATFFGSAPLSIALTLLAAFGAWRSLANRESRVTALVLVAWLLTDVICLYVWGAVKDRGAALRYMLGVLPPMILLAGLGLDGLVRLRLIGVAAIVAASLFVLRGYYDTPKKQDFRGALLFSAGQRGCVTASAHLPSLLNAYSKMLGLSMTVADNDFVARPKKASGLAPGLSCEDAPEIWVIWAKGLSFTPIIPVDLHETGVKSFGRGVKVSGFSR